MKLLTLIAILCGYLWTNTAVAEWTFDSSSDPFADTKLAMIGQVVSRDNFLAIKCEGGSDPYIVIDFGEFFESDSARDVQYRFDDNEPSTIRMTRYPGIASILFALAPDALDFIEKMKAGNTLVVRATPYSDPPVTLAFDLSGFTAAFNRCMNAVR